MSVVVDDATTRRRRSDGVGSLPRCRTLLHLGAITPYGLRSPEDFVRKLGVEVLPMLSVRSRGEIKALRRQGFEVMIVEQMTDFEEVLATVERSGRADAIDIVHTNFEHVPVVASALAECLDADGPRPRTAILARDKFLQKKSFRARGVPTADSALIADGSSIDDAEVRRIGFPAVLKPVRGTGARATTKVLDSGHLRVVLDRYLPSEGPMLLEAFLSGIEYHVDGVLDAGRIAFISVSRYLTNVLQVRQGHMPMSVTLDPLTEREIYEKFGAVVQEALTAVGAVSCVFHLELFTTEEGVKVSEVATRIGGGGIVWAAKRKFGVDLYEAALAMALGMQWCPPAEVSSGSVGWMLVKHGGGTLAKRPSRAAVMRLPGVVGVRFDAAVGSEVKDVRSSGGPRIAQVVLQAGSPDDLTAAMLSCAEFFGREVDVLPP